MACVLSVRMMKDEYIQYHKRFLAYARENVWITTQSHCDAGVSFVISHILFIGKRVFEKRQMALTTCAA